MEAPPGFEPGMEVLQTSALPLGDGAVRKPDWKFSRRSESGVQRFGRTDDQSSSDTVVRLRAARYGATTFA